jgi:hypothetical protein
MPASVHMPDKPETANWYTRREGTIRGPYSAGHVSRYLLLGRIRASDELSRDGRNWCPVSECPELLPDEFGDLSSWQDYQQLVMARISADERRARRRSQEPGVPPPGVSERRTGVERRRLDRDMAAFTCHLPGHREVPHRQWQACPLRACLLATLLATLIIAWIGVAFR